MLPDISMSDMQYMYIKRHWVQKSFFVIVIFWTRKWISNQTNKRQSENSCIRKEYSEFCSHCQWLKDEKVCFRIVSYVSGLIKRINLLSQQKDTCRWSIFSERQAIVIERQISCPFLRDRQIIDTSPEPISAVHAPLHSHQSILYSPLLSSSIGHPHALDFHPSAGWWTSPLPPYKTISPLCKYWLATLLSPHSEVGFSLLPYIRLYHPSTSAGHAPFTPSSAHHPL